MRGVLPVTVDVIPQKFFANCSNVFDLCVMAVAVIAQLLYIHPPEVAAAASTCFVAVILTEMRSACSDSGWCLCTVTSEEWTELSATAFRIVRDGVLFARLYIFMKKYVLALLMRNVPN